MLPLRGCSALLRLLNFTIDKSASARKHRKAGVCLYEKNFPPFWLKGNCLISAVLHWIAQIALNITVFDYLGQNPIVYTIFFLLCWHGWLIYVNWCARLYKGCCDQGQTRKFLLYRNLSVCCYCIEACDSSGVNSYFNFEFTNFLLTPAISCHFWGVSQCNTLDFNCKFSLLRRA